jgi:hypothetical protein
MIPQQSLPPSVASDQERLLKLIGTYLRSVAVVTELVLQRGLAVGHPLRTWEEGRLPKRGKLPETFGGTFRFRGHGCVVHQGGQRVEFDFGPGGRYDGFTAFYLHRHVRLNKLVRREFGNLDIDAGVLSLKRLGLAFQPDWEPTPHLLYLSTMGQQRLVASTS